MTFGEQIRTWVESHADEKPEMCAALVLAAAELISQSNDPAQAREIFVSGLDMMLAVDRIGHH